MMKIAITVLLIYLVPGVAFAQHYDNSAMSVPLYPEQSTSELLLQLSNADVDSTRIRILLQLSSAYWYRGHDRDLDSVLIYSEEAQKISGKRKFIDALLQSKFYICRAFVEKKEIQRADSVMQSAHGDQKIRLALTIGEHFMYLPDFSKANLTTAFRYFNYAYRLSNLSSVPVWKEQCLKALGKCYFADKQFQKGKQCFLMTIQGAVKKGDRANEAFLWAELAIYTPKTEDNYNERVQAFKKAISIYNILGKKFDAAYTYEDLCVMNLEYRKFAVAESQGQELLLLFNALKIKKISTVYLFLGEANYGLGNFDKALFFVLESIKNMDLTKYKRRIGQAYLDLGDIYRAMGDHQNSLKFYRQAIDLRSTWSYYTFITYYNIAQEMILCHQPEEALSFLKKVQQNHPELRFDEMEIMSAAFGDCYTALNRPELAERAYLKMIRLDHEARELTNNDIRYVLTISGSEAHYRIARFYFDQQNFDQANRYLNQSLIFRNFSPVLLKDIRLLQFRLDSVARNSSLALVHFRQYVALKDSLFNVARMNQVSALQIRYNTEQKEKDIKLLEQKDSLKSQQLLQSNQSRTFRLLIILLLVVILGIGYSRYRLKQRANRQLEKDKSLISIKNTDLEQLVAEKEWLMKEVHHRVKNNLQIVQGLLNSQSAYLKDEAALNAIKESQHRVQAMSLIHEKLYKSNNVSAVYMPEYVRDLIEYFDNSFRIGQSIYFRIQIEPLHLDVSQAIPLTLILNELLSNVIKHGFPISDPLHDEVTVELTEQGESEVVLKVCDNGVGLGKDFDLMSNNSFGLTLVRGLADELHGKFVVGQGKGTCIAVSFTRIASTDSYINLSIKL